MGKKIVYIPRVAIVNKCNYPKAAGKETGMEFSLLLLKNATRATDTRQVDMMCKDDTLTVGLNGFSGGLCQL